MIAAWGRMAAQVSVYPPVLYPGINVITITAESGLSNIDASIDGGRWGHLVTGYENSRLRIISAPTFVQCGKKATFMVLVKTPRVNVSIELQVRDCDGDSRGFDIDLSESWVIDRQDFGTVNTGTTDCEVFSVRSSGALAIILDSVVSPSPRFPISYLMQRPPVRINAGASYRYNVCFSATAPGVYKMPILTYIRRKYPAGGFTNFIVADTAYVTVVGSPIIAAVPTPPKPRPTGPRVLVAPPPQIIIPRPPPKPDTPRVIPPVLAARARSVPVVPEPPEPARRAASEPLPGIPIPGELTDPTSHRVVLMPTARSVDSGRFFLSNYELGGFLAGYGATDRLTLLGGFAYVPSFINYNLVGTLGGRYEMFREGIIRAALGAQGSYSRSDVSSIVLLSPYAVVSVGDDDRRGSVAVSYAWRHHTPLDTTVIPFDRSAVVVALGGDYRIANHWKLAGELYVIGDANVQPVVLAARYFTKRFAIDGGLGLDLGMGNGEGVKLGPVVTATWVW
jgi:hypothetical protein